jgi:hypothetical protein
MEEKMSLRIEKQPELFPWVENPQNKITAKTKKMVIGLLGRLIAETWCSTHKSTDRAGSLQEDNDE